MQGSYYSAPVRAGLLWRSIPIFNRCPPGLLRCFTLAHTMNWPMHIPWLLCCITLAHAGLPWSVPILCTVVMLFSPSNPCPFRVHIQGCCDESPLPLQYSLDLTLVHAKLLHYWTIAHARFLWLTQATQGCCDVSPLSVQGCHDFTIVHTSNTVPPLSTQSY